MSSGNVVVVVGAGLAGLTAAHALHTAGMPVRVIEARGRVGGRIMTLFPPGTEEGAGLDLGATWLWSDQREVQALVRELSLTTFPQFRSGLALADEGTGRPPAPVEVPEPSPAERRIVGGAHQLCSGLTALLPEGSIFYSTSVTGLDEAAGGLSVAVADADDGSWDMEAEFVVVAVPPRLALQHIRFAPALPADVTQVMEATPTWMGAAMKCVAVYESAFWREEGWSGLAFSASGPLIEVHDACSDDGSVAALWGFVSADHAFRDLTPDQRTPLVLTQLEKLFGAAAADPVLFFERDWSNDPNTNDEVVWIGDPLEYGNPAFNRPAMAGRLVWAGAETVGEGGGHMEGAIRSGVRAAGVVLDSA